MLLHVLFEIVDGLNYPRPAATSDRVDEPLFLDCIT